MNFLHPSWRAVVAAGQANPWPGAPDYIFDLTNPANMLNASSVQCAYGEKARYLIDSSGSARHGDQATSGSQGYAAPVIGGANYLWCGGSSGSPHVSSIAPTNSNPVSELTVEGHISADDWTPAADRVIASRNNGATAAGSAWLVVLATTGALIFYWYSGGTTYNTTSTANLSALAAHADTWFRVHYTQNTGSGQYAVVFETSPDGVTWSALGTTRTGASTGNINSVTMPVYLGAAATGGGLATWAGRIFKMRLRNGNPAASILNDFDAASYSHFTNSSGNFTSGNGHALMAKSGIVPANIASYPIPTVALGNMTAGMLCKGNTVSQMIGFGTSGASHPIPLYAGVSTLYFANDTNQNNRVVSSATRANIVTQFNGTTWSALVNGSDATGIASSPIAAGTTLNRLLSRNTDRSIGVVSKLILYTSATPARASVATWLDL